MSFGDVACRLVALRGLAASPIGPMVGTDVIGTAARRLADSVAWRLRPPKELSRSAIIAHRLVQKGYSYLGKCVKSALGGVTSTPPKRPLFRNYADRRITGPHGNEGDCDV